jgi:hypothetical protein
MFGSGPTQPTIQFNGVFYSVNQITPPSPPSPPASPPVPTGGQGFTTGDNYYTPSFPSGSIQYNAMFAKYAPADLSGTQGGISTMFQMNASQITGPFTIGNNYLDVDWIWDQVFPADTGSVTITNNINMVTGEVITP